MTIGDLVYFIKIDESETDYRAKFEMVQGEIVAHDAETVRVRRRDGRLSSILDPYTNVARDAVLPNRDAMIERYREIMKQLRSGK